MAEDKKTGAAADAKSDAQFVIQRVYVKDLSFENPKSPQSFQQEWKPKMTLDLNTSNSSVDKDVYEVVLSVVATVNNTVSGKDEVAFLVEVKQAGIFTIKGVEGEQLDRLLGSYCPNILFPYAREVITDAATRGSFPQLVLAPVNFDALYAKQMEVKQSKAAGGKK